MFDLQCRLPVLWGKARLSAVGRSAGVRCRTGEQVQIKMYSRETSEELIHLGALGESFLTTARSKCKTIWDRS